MSQNSDYFEAEIEPLFGTEIESRYKKAKHVKQNGKYSYRIRIIELETNKIVYETVSWGENQKDAVLNFRKNEAEIRLKYLNLSGYALGVLRF